MMHLAESYIQSVRMTSPSEHNPESRPATDPSFPSMSGDEASPLRRLALDIWTQKVDELLLVLKDSCADAAQSVDLKVQQDLRHELEKMGESPHFEQGFGLLREIARECATRPDTVAVGASMLNRFLALAPNQSQIDRIRNLAIPSEEDRQLREEVVIENARLSFLCNGGRLSSISCESYLKLIERGVDILEQSTLFHNARLGLIDVMGALAEARGSFRGVKAMRESFEAAVTQPEVELLSVVLRAGALVGDAPKGLGQLASEVVRKVVLDTATKSALMTALPDQVRNNGSVRDLLEAFGKLYDSWGNALDRKQGMLSYVGLIETLRPHNAALHLVTRSHVDQFIKADRRAYAEALGDHVKAVQELVRLAQDSEKFERAELRALQSIVSSYPNPAMTKTFGMVLHQIDRRVDNPQQIIRTLCSLAMNPDVSPAKWSDIADMLNRQIPKGRAFDGVVSAVAEVVSHVEVRGRGRDFWSNFVILSKSLGEEVPDLSYVTKDLLQAHLKDPSERNYRYLVSLLNCADVVAEPFNGDCKTSSDLVTRLLRTDGLAECLVKAVAHHRKLGLDGDALYDAYPTLDRELHPRGVSLLHTIVNYQIFHGFPLGEVFRNFRELSVVKGDKENPEGVWSQRQRAMEQLGSAHVPLDFFGVAIARELLEEPSDSPSFDRAEETLRLLHTLSPERRPAPPETPARRLSPDEERRTLNLLAAAADGGVKSPAARVLTMLANPENASHERFECSDVAQMCTAPEQVSDQAWVAIGKSIEGCRERGYSLRRLCKSIFDLDAEIAEDGAPAKETWRAATELMFALQEAPLSGGERGLPYDLLSHPFIDRYMKAGEVPQALLVHFLVGMTGFSEKLRAAALVEGAKNPHEHVKDLRRTLNEITDQGFGLTDNPAMVHKLKLILAEGGVGSLQEFHTVLRDLKMHALTDIMRNASDEDRKAWARGLMGKEFNMGGPPYVQGTAEAKRHFNETMQVVDRAFRDSKGFGGMALDTRGLPRTSRFDPVPPMLVRFGLDSAEKTYIVNSSDNSHFPGKGFYISGIKVDRVFSVDQRWKERGKTSPHWRWLEGQGLFASDYFHEFSMQDFGRCGFLPLRGLQIVVPPPERRYVLDGVPYCYAVYNRHFAPYTQAALGIPTTIINELLGNSLIDANDFRGLEKTRTDIAKADFSYQGLLAACQRRKLNLLDLTYGSVIGGGLCNAFLPRSLPHYEWQLTAGASAGWTDSWGHIHKSFRLGHHSSMGKSLDEQLNYARALHYDVLEVFRPLQDYLSAFRFALSFYKMGSTLAKDADLREQDEEQDENDQDDEQAEAGGEAPERLVHEYRFRMLQESYRWHHGGREQRWQFEQFPELHFAWVLDPNSLPPLARRKFHLDTASMILKTEAGTFQLPKDGDGSGEEERAIWAEHVVPFFDRNSTGWEPRFLMRHGAFSIYE